ncbi:hypothetical protein FRIG_15675, partial [Frigoribacterium faeni]|uniref:hypothetical protein n=1 Tax=Frigoribacterium faeni TaxID=145483 RepID=UPI001FABFBAB
MIDDRPVLDVRWAMPAAVGWIALVVLLPSPDRLGLAAAVAAVSYTHLTLPTTDAWGRSRGWASVLKDEIW